MKTVISASRRTDIPAFYMNWFMEAIRLGSLEVENPFYPAQKKQVDLSPEAVSWIVFWSRNYAHFLKHHRIFEAYQLFFHFTILSKSKLERSAIPLNRALTQLDRLCSLYGAERIVWRYDPLVYWKSSGQIQNNFNEQEFTDLCKRMEQNNIERCYTSFAYPYRKFSRRFRRFFANDTLVQPDETTQDSQLLHMQAIAGTFGISIFSCCNDRLLQVPGIQKGHCIDGHLLNKLNPNQKISNAKSPTRPNCGCTRAVDIGSYRQQPCAFGCMYCYANPVIR